MAVPAVIKALLVEDDPEDVLLLKDLMQGGDADRINLVREASLERAAIRLSTESFDVILLDLSLPDAQGIAALNGARAAAPATPVIVLCSRATEATALLAVERGAQDYLIKAPGNRLSVSRVRRAMRRFLSEEQHSATTRMDPLTGLANRYQFREDLKSGLLRKKDEQQANALLYMDLDRFKAINDSLGHHNGDRLLASVAERLQALVDSRDALARMGGDEFAILLGGQRAEQAEALADGIVATMSTPFQIAGQEFYITPSIGLVTCPAGERNVEMVLQNAESAMYRAKENGGNRWEGFTHDMTAPAAERLRLETDLRRALERDELVLYYQPQINLNSGKLTGVEALLRWHHPTLGLLPPGQFIWLAEETGLIQPIGEWVLKTACFQAREWQDKGLKGVHMVVNLSAQQFHQNNLVEQVKNVLNSSGLKAKDLALEITEGAMLTNNRLNDRTLAGLKGLGVKISIDDFGVGYSSLSYLKRIPADILKLDRCFVRDVDTDPGNAAISRAVIALAQGLSLSIVAEGVETTGQLNFLREHGCDGVQGYLMARPAPAHAVEKLIRSGIPLPC